MPSEREREREPAPSTDRWAIAFEPPIVRRGLFAAAIVGTLLIAINHGSAILEGDVTKGRVARMALSVVVPYIVSVVSSVAAVRQMRLRDTTDARDR